MGRLYVYMGQIRANPYYVLMRGLARFKTIRHLFRILISFNKRINKTEINMRLCDSETKFAGADISEIVSKLKKEGYATGINLPEDICDEILNYARSATCYAERDPALGFRIDQLDSAQKALKRPILIGQFFNSIESCKAIANLGEDLALKTIAAQYLEAEPVHVGTLLWWSFPAKSGTTERNRAAQMFHYDLDDFGFLKFFFYITDVDTEAGPHVIVSGSHEKKRYKNILERFLVRRYTDEEIRELYGEDKVKIITGKSGTGFAEDTLCIHKGQPPETKRRLLLQVQYALRDYSNQNDIIEKSKLHSIIQKDRSNELQCQ